MSRNNNSGNSGCLVAFIIGYIILAIIGGLSNAVGPTAAWIIIGAVIFIVVLVVKSSKKAAEEENKRQAAAAEQRAKEQAAEAERQRNLAIVNATESKPYAPYISSSMSFSNKEEELVNLSFREFTKKNGDIKAAQAHIDYLNKKIPALRALNREGEIAGIQEQISASRAELVNIHARDGRTFDSKWANAFGKVSEIQTAYSAFISRLPNDRMDWIGDFFQSPKIKTIRISDSAAMIFTPLYVLVYSGMGQIIKVIPYKEVSVRADVTTELLDGYSKPGDEIQRISYLHTNSDGSRDMRYSYANNPSYTYVYRGKISIATSSGTAIVNLNNKSNTEDYEKQVKAFLNLVSEKYSPAVEKLLAHDESALGPDGIQSIIDKAELAEKKKEDQRKERAAAAEAKRKQQQAEREAAEREKQRKAEFMRNLTIVDGTLTNWYGSERNFVLPEGLASVIGTAFRWKNNLETVSIANGVKTIQANAFYGSSALKKVELPASVSSIGKEAFFGCSSLTDIVLPKAINTITAQMFGKCSSLKTLTIPVGVKKIERGAFSGCSSLTEIVVPEGVTTIEDDAFENCVKLKKVVLPNSITKFGKNVFSGCVSLEHVTLGNGIKRIPEACFNNHQKLIDVAVASDIVEIGDRAFRNCQKLSSLTFIEKDKSSMAKGMDFERMITGATSSNDRFALDSLERIGKSAFENCFAFKGIELKDGIRTIAEYAFANCRLIKTIILPKTIQTFGTGAFAGCTSLLKVDGAENVRWQKKNCFTGSPWLASQATDGFVIFDDYLEAYTGTDSVVELPANVKIIGRSAFDGNPYVSNIRIPDGVTSIEELAFANCKKLKTVFISDSVTHIEDNAFSGDTDFLIQCSRGSAASAFRIRNKLPGEYIAKTKTEVKDRTTRRKPRSSAVDGLSDLSEEELRVIMEMRREKIAKKKAEEEKPVVPETIEYSLVQYDRNMVSIKLASDGRKITNNIFNLRFVQNEQAGEKAPTEYETFVVDTYGQIISDIKTICANKEGADLTHKVTYSLSAQEKFDKAAEYFVILRYKNAGLNILSKTQYQISIDFASDFDF